MIVLLGGADGKVIWGVLVTCFTFLAGKPSLLAQLSKGELNGKHRVGLRCIYFIYIHSR